MIGYPAGSESSDDVEVSSGGELVPLLTLTFSKSGSLGDEGSKNMDGRHTRDLNRAAVVPAKGKREHVACGIGPCFRSRSFGGAPGP